MLFCRFWLKSNLLQNRHHLKALFALITMVQFPTLLDWDTYHKKDTGILGGGGVIYLSDIDRKLVVVCIKYGIFNIVFLLRADIQLTEYPVKESEVLKQLNLVTISKREVEVVSKYLNMVMSYFPHDVVTVSQLVNTIWLAPCCMKCCVPCA